MKITKTITRPALRYYGGAWLRSEWTISHFPSHDNYLEPCFGAGSILARKPIARLETVNDINGRTVNFFRVLRQRPQELLYLIQLTPWARDELQACLPVADDPLEDARRFFMACWGSVEGGPRATQTGFRIQNDLNGRYTSPPYDTIKRYDLLQFAKRLKKVQIENIDAIDLIKKHVTNQTGSLIYFDPPYLPSTRQRTRGYSHEPPPAWHRLAAHWLRQHNGPVVVAGYPSRLYQRIYEAHGWILKTRKFGTNGTRKGQECLWLNPVCVDQLAAEYRPSVMVTRPLLELMR